MNVNETRIAISSFLSDQLPKSLQSVDYLRSSFSEPSLDEAVEQLARAKVEVRHAVGASDAFYLISAFQDKLLMQVQLNVRRFVIIFRVPAIAPANAESLRPRFHMWERGAVHVGWEMLWRDSVRDEEPDQVYIEIYCYASPSEDFLENEREQLFWRTDIVQMTRSFMLEARHIGVRLNPIGAGYSI
jgi:hypothetical protein